MIPRKRIWSLATAQTLLWSGLYYLFPALLLSWEAETGWSRPQLTLSFTLSLLVSALCAPLTGRLIDRGNAHRLLPGTAIAGGLLLLLLPAAPSWTAFTAVWILIGFCRSGCLYEACFAYVVRETGQGAQRVITHISLMAGFAGTLAFPLARGLARSAGTETAVQVFGYAIIMFAVPLLIRGVRSSAPKNPSPESLHPQTTPYPVFRKPVFWFSAAAFSLFVTNHAAVLNHLLPILNEWELSPDLGVLAVAMIGPMQVLGRLLWMCFDRNLSVSRVAMLCFIGLNLATLLLMAAHQSPIFLAGFVVLQGASYGLICIVRPILIRHLLGAQNFGAISGAQALPYLICTATAPTLASLLWLRYGYPFTLSILWTLSMLGLACLAISLGLHRRLPHRGINIK